MTISTTGAGPDNLWVIVVPAAGTDREAAVITSTGVAVPKEYWPFGDGRSLLGRTLERALGLVPAARVVAVVNPEQRRWWEAEVARLLSHNVIPQPRDRGTALGVLLPLVEIFRRDHDALVLTLPAGHYVRDEAPLRETLLAAVDAAARASGRIVVLGATPEFDGAEKWMLPDGHNGAPLRPVLEFVEPDSLTSPALLGRGALVNSHMVAAQAHTLLAAYDHALPDVFWPLVGAANAGIRSPALCELYDDLSENDFSTDVLERCAERLAVTSLPACGWNDLRTSTRFARFLMQLGTPRQPAPRLPDGHAS